MALDPLTNSKDGLSQKGSCGGSGEVGRGSDMLYFVVVAVCFVFCLLLLLLCVSVCVCVCVRGRVFFFFLFDFSPSSFSPILSRSGGGWVGGRKVGGRFRSFQLRE